MIFSVVVYSAPASTQSSRSAYQFCQAALAAGHRIYRLFFYDDGVLNASRLTVTAQDERNTADDWANLIRTHELDAVACVASALQRGILDAGEASRYEKDASNMAPDFEISGLGQWLDACLHSDRVVSFGA